MIIELGNNTITKNELCEYIKAHSSFKEMYKIGTFYANGDPVIDVKDKYIILGSSFEIVSKNKYSRCGHIYTSLV